MDSTEALKEYVITKITKDQRLIEKATSIEVILTENHDHRGVAKDNRIDINVSVPNSKLHVEEIGDDMYAVIDKASEIIYRRFKRYMDKIQQWSGVAPWETEEYKAQFVEDEHFDSEYDYGTYVPKVAVRKKVKDPRPMEEGEAIELMELMGYRPVSYTHLTLPTKRIV